MTVVWGAVQDHDGYIDVKSELGEGTTFELYFPVTRQTVEYSETATSVTELRGNGESILIVDDIRDQREISTAILTHLHYSVFSVESGEAAIEYLGKNRIDLVVLDMIMDPGLDGLETYRQIRKIVPSQKTIIASGFSENDRVREAIKLGVGSYIRKPFTTENLGQVIRRELSKVS